VEHREEAPLARKEALHVRVDDVSKANMRPSMQPPWTRNWSKIYLHAT